MRRSSFSKIFSKKRDSFSFSDLFLLIIVFILIAELFAVGWIMYNRYIRNNKTSPLIQKLIIRTDRSYYARGETIKITMDNQVSLLMKNRAEARTRSNIKTRKFFGNNYGIGLIEKMINGSWVAVEPVWRCGNSCFQACGQDDHIINAYNNKIYIWEQNMLICDKDNNTERINWAGYGKYRITAAVWSEGMNKITKVHSKEFMVR